MATYNHNRTLSSFEEQLSIIKEHGFNPIAVSQLYLEDTFVFKTNKEAKEAFNMLENIEESKLVGWWYGKKEFEKVVDEYEKEDPEYKVLIYWLTNK